MASQILVAMSGGVDSAVAAWLLQKKGYEVVGATMCLGVPEAVSKRPVCCGVAAINDARSVCEKLHLRHFVLDFSRELEKFVIKKFVEEYCRGRTPNPCVDCNTFLKFKFLFEKASALGFDFLATGHYVRLVKKGAVPFLKKARDLKKDQSYFLYGIKKKVLPKLLFPLGNLVKEEVREIARKEKLPVANKTESQDICFIPSGNREKIILSKIKNIKKGLIVNRQGEILGEHRGLAFYTVGQRAGLGISWRYPLYVIKIDAPKNQLVVGEKKDLLQKTLVAGELNWFVNKIPQSALAKIRYSHALSGCRMRPMKEGSGKIKVVFSEPQPAATPGQAIVFYNKSGLVLGGGVIEEVLDEYC
jgi:tRNA-specific 2-thiouridylase